MFRDSVAMQYDNAILEYPEQLIINDGDFNLAPTHCLHLPEYFAAGLSFPLYKQCTIWTSQEVFIVCLYIM
jgi:hypothetical protein